MSILNAPAAAKKLGVSERRMRALAESGSVPAEKVGSRWIFDSDLLLDHLHRNSSPGRPFSQLHALGLLFLASDEEPSWLSGYEKWRLARSVRPGLREALPRLRARARVGFWRAPVALIDRLQKEARFVRSGVSAAEEVRAEIHGRGIADGYWVASEAAALIHRYALSRVAEAAANLVIREVDDPRPLEHRRVMPVAVVAADLSESSSARARRAGQQLLDRVNA